MKLNPFLRKVAYSFGRAFLGVFIVGLTGVWVAPTFTAQKAALVALLSAAVIAGLRAVQHVFIDSPTPGA